MTNSKNTKRALFTSILSVMLCMAMLVGSTFAWFTDSVTSGNNRIVAGNLKVDLVMDKTGNGTYTSIANGEGDIFAEAGIAQNSNATLWEPGKTQIVYLGVQNKGSLALKYNIVLNVTDGGLIGSLEYAVLDGKTAADLSDIKSWAELTAMAGTQTGDITAGQVTAAPNGRLDEIVNGVEDETDYFALAVHMKEEAGNEYKNKEVTIDVNVVATQADAESDSFGDQYDAGIECPIIVNSVDELINAIGNLQAGDSAVIEMNDNIEVNANVTIPENVTVILDMKNNKIGHETAEQIGVTTLVNNGNLTIRNAEIYSKDGMLNNTASATANAALTSLGGNVVLEKCKLNNFSGRAFGSYCVGISGGTVTLNDCIIDGYRGGISLGEDAVMIASNCTVNAQFYYPVYMYGQSTAYFTNCTFNKCKVENPLNPNQAGNGGLIFDNRDESAPIAEFDTCTFNSTWKDGAQVPLEFYNNLAGMTFTNCTFGDNITGVPSATES